MKVTKYKNKYHITYTSYFGYDIEPISGSCFVYANDALQAEDKSYDVIDKQISRLYGDGILSEQTATEIHKVTQRNGIIRLNGIKKTNAYELYHHKYNWHLPTSSVIYTAELLDAFGYKTDLRYLRNLSEKETDELINYIDWNDKERYNIYYRTPEGFIVNHWDNESDDNGNWIITPDSGKKFNKFYKLIQV